MENTTTATATAAAVIKVQRADLVAALASLKFKGNRPATIPILQNVLFDVPVGFSNIVTISATDLEVGTARKIAAESGPCGELGHNGARFCVNLAAPEAIKDKPEPSTSYIIPSEALKRAAKLTDGPLSVIFTDNAAYFGTDSGYLVTWTVQGNFPNVDAVRAKSWANICAFNGPALLAVLKSLPKTHKKGQGTIRLKFSGAGMILQHNGADVYKAELSEGAFPEPFEISFNPDFLMDILRVCKGSIQMRLNSNTQPATAFTGNEAEYLIMPLRTC